MTFSSANLKERGRVIEGKKEKGREGGRGTEPKIVNYTKKKISI